MRGLDLEAGDPQQLEQRIHGEVEQVAWQVEVEPGRPAPTRLGAREVRHRHDQAPARTQDAAHLLERPARIVEVLEDVPDHHLVEALGLVAGVGETGSDADLRTRIRADRRRGVHLHAVHLEAAIGELAQHHAATAAHIEDAAARSERPREEADVPRGHQSHQTLDQRPELHAGLPVVIAGIEALQLRSGRHRMCASQPAVGADEHPPRHTLDLEARPRFRATAHRAGRYAVGRMDPRVETPHGALVELADRQRNLARAVERPSVRCVTAKVKRSAAAAV